MRPRNLVAAHPAEFCIAWSLFAVSIVFWVTPDALEHTAVAFETRGILHHVWHGVLTAASALILMGLMWSYNKWIVKFKVRLLGLLGLFATLLMNLTSAVFDSVTTSGDDMLGGIDFALRVAVITFLTIRIETVARSADPRA